MPTRTPARRPDTSDLDHRIDTTRAAAVVMWRGEPIPLTAVPERVARLSGRETRERLFDAWREGLEAVNPLLEQRLAAWIEGADVVAQAAASGPDPRGVAVDLERFVVHGETPYYAALRRYLALLDIEQGDATEADLWHVVRGAAWAHWFGQREVARAISAMGRTPFEAAGLDGWRAAEAMLGGVPAGSGSAGTAAVAAAYGSLVGSPTWLRAELGVADAEVVPLADFIAFVRLWRIRREIALLQYELRLFAAGDDLALARAYYAGIVGHMTGVLVPEEAWLHDVPVPFGSVTAISASLLAPMVVEVLEGRHGEAWWRDPDAAQLVADIGAAERTEDVLARLGYDALDWRPVLRQIRTRLIGEMSGYGGPNITTRAGTRKV